MTATNHAITGALIGLAVGNPFVAFPAAIASHFVCDALPHFGPSNPDDLLTSTKFKIMLIIEAILCFVLVVVLSVAQPLYWQVAAVSAFLATSPDIMWIGRFRRAQRGQLLSERPALILRFHKSIQWFERPIGAVVELAWAVAGIILLKLFIF